MGQPQSKSQQQRLQLGDIVRESSLIFRGTYDGFEPPPKIEVDDSKDVGVQGNMVTQNAVPENKLKPDYLTVALKPEEVFALALNVSDVPKVIEVLEEEQHNPQFANTELPLLGSKALHSPLWHAVNASQSSDKFFGGPSLSNNCKAGSSTFFRQASGEDALSCVQWLIRSGAVVTEEVLQVAGKESFGHPRTKVFSYLRRFASPVLREKYPLYEPSTSPIRYRFNVSMVFASSLQSEEQTSFVGPASHRGVKEEHLPSLSKSKEAIVFVNAKGEVASYAIKSTSCGYWSIVDVLHPNDSSSVTPSFIHPQQLQAWSDGGKTSLDYTILSTIQWTSPTTAAKDQHQLRSVQVTVNVLDDWNVAESIKLAKFPHLEGWTVSRASLGNKVYYLHLVKGSKGLTLAGLVEGVVDDPATSIPTYNGHMWASNPPLLSELEFKTFVDFPVSSVGVMSVCMVELSSPVTQRFTLWLSMVQGNDLKAVLVQSDAHVEKNESSDGANRFLFLKSIKKMARGNGMARKHKYTMEFEGCTDGGVTSKSKAPSATLEAEIASTADNSIPQNILGNQTASLSLSLLNDLRQPTAGGRSIEAAVTFQGGSGTLSLWKTCLVPLQSNSAAPTFIDWSAQQSYNLDTADNKDVSDLLSALLTGLFKERPEEPLRFLQSQLELRKGTAELMGSIEAACDYLFGDAHKKGKKDGVGQKAKLETLDDLSKKLAHLQEEARRKGIRRTSSDVSIGTAFESLNVGLQTMAEGMQEVVGGLAGGCNQQ